MKNILFLFFLFLFFIPTTAQNTFMKTFGGTGDDIAFSGIVTNDGGYLIVGETTSFGNGGKDGYLLKIDSFGTELWSKTIGGTADDRLWDVVELTNGDYIASGRTFSYGNGNDDAFLVRFDNNGNAIWQKTYGAASTEMTYVLTLTSDNYILATGRTTSFGSGGEDVLLMKIDLNGHAIWSKAYGQSGSDWPLEEGVAETANGNYRLTGSWSINVGIPQHNGFVLELDTAGNLLDSKVYGGINNDGIVKFIEGNTTNYLLGSSWSWSNGTNNEFWLSGIDEMGNVIWSKSYGIANENIRPVTGIFTNNSEFILSGFEFTNTTIGNSIIFKVDEIGDIVWAKSYGGGGLDRITKIKSISSGIIAFGHTDSYGQGGRDIWLIKTDAQGNVGTCSTPIFMNTATVTPSVATLSSNVATSTFGESINAVISTPVFEEAIECISMPPSDSSENHCTLYIPNAFTPNHDGVNDLFQVYVPDDCIITSFSIQVFDRWGNVVFTSTDVNEKWDGVFRAEQVESGVYVWLVNYSDGINDYLDSGDVMVIR